MQNNIPCHTVKSVKTFLSEKDVTVMEWPVQIPDMNPIENVWKLLNERAKEKNQRIFLFLIIYFFECYIIILIILSK